MVFTFIKTLVRAKLLRTSVRLTQLRLQTFSTTDEGSKSAIQALKAKGMSQAELLAPYTCMKLQELLAWAYRQYGPVAAAYLEGYFFPAQDRHNAAAAAAILHLENTVLLPYYKRKVLLLDTQGINMAQHTLHTEICVFLTRQVAIGRGVTV